MLIVNVNTYFLLCASGLFLLPDFLLLSALEDKKARIIKKWPPRSASIFRLYKFFVQVVCPTGFGEEK